MGTLRKGIRTFVIKSRKFFLECETFQTKVLEKIKTRCMFSNFFFRKSCRLWDNVEKCSRTRQAIDGNIIRRKRFACWITKATNTHSEYVMLIAFAGNYAYTNNAPVLRYTYLACPAIANFTPEVDGLNRCRWSLYFSNLLDVMMCLPVLFFFFGTRAFHFLANAWLFCDKRFFIIRIPKISSVVSLG